MRKADVHSERRQYFGETDKTVNQRVRAALDAGLKVILCVGELLEQREQGITEEICAMQTKVALGGVSKEELSRIIIAYEPVWAIGTGMVATPQSAQDAARAIRNDLSDTFGTRVGETVRILYGGSVSSKNAVELINEPDVDGFLIGGSALKVDELTRICKLTLETTA